MSISPQIFKNIRKIEIRTNRYVQDVLAGAYHSAFKGHGMEFEEVREYQPGDEVRCIDWNVTARMQYPYVKNFREERELSVFILVDVSASSLFGTTGKKKSELIAEIGALFAFSAIKNNDKVGLILFSDRVEKYLPAQKGSHHVLRVIRELLTFSPQSQKTDIGKALSFLSKVRKRSSVVFLISDFLSPPFKEELAYASKKHDVIGVHVRDPHELVIPKVGMLQLKDLETQKLLMVDTRSRRVREALQERGEQKLKELKQLFESLSSGFINIVSDQMHLQAISNFFNKRRAVK